MCVTGSVKRGSLNILVDSGSTHNFLDFYKAKRMGYTADQITPVLVAIANGEKLVCREVCQNLRWEIQGHEFMSDVFLLRLGGCDMVLGVEWLATLGDIVWNFQELTMKFSHKGQDYSLQGLEETKQKEIGVHVFEKLMQMTSCNTTPLMRYLVFTQWVPDISCKALHIQYDDNKEEIALPPSRTSDHKIPLKQGAEPVNIRPYRYSILQKGALEGIISDMLQAGTIQPSNSPFSSPVVLVKKKYKS